GRRDALDAAVVLRARVSHCFRRDRRMIPVGTLCIIVGDPKPEVPRLLPGRICTAISIPGEAKDGTPCVCDIRFPNGTRATVVHWGILRPITPPPQATDDREIKPVE